MLSRVAESIYWMSRYVERAENVARFIDVNQHLLLDTPLEQSGQWEPLVITTHDDEDFWTRYDHASQENVTHFLTFDRQNPNSILTCLAKARENARTVREAISSAMWDQINRFYLMVRDAAANGGTLESSHAFYTDVKMASHLFTGIAQTTMSHGEAWQFARIGRLIERADKTARILDVKYFFLLPDASYVGTPYDVILWSALLKSASAFEMYRKRFRQIQPDRVAQFLILNREFPRSLHFCVVGAEESLRAITGSRTGTFSNPLEQRVGRLRSELDYAQIDEIIAGGLHEYLDGFEAKLNRVDEAVYEAFFAIRPLPVSEAA